jgi:Uncharacterized protein related to capsule biosynthesis enzymes
MFQFVQIYFHGKPLGVMARDAVTHTAQFEFYPEFLQKGWGISPILFPMEKIRNQPKILTFENTGGLPPFLMDTLPGAYARDLLGYALQGTQQTPEKLSSQSYLSLLGNRGMGAFSFEPSGYPELNAVETVDFDMLVRYARQLYDGSALRLSDRRLRELLRSGLFTRGSWPKALIAINDFTGEVMSGQGAVPEGFDGWIIKLDGVRAESQKVLGLEYEYYKKALDCGIAMAPCRTLRDGHKVHLLCKRFDRLGSEKIHVQSFASLREVSEDSYEEVFRCMRQLRLSGPEMEQMFRRVVFNVLVGNCNDTARKVDFTFSPQEGLWRLAPAYNLRPTPDKTNHALSVGGKWKDITKENLLELGRMLHIRQAKVIVAKCTEVLGK